MIQNTGIERLLAIMARLRDPARGCPWDREQTFATIAPYTIEEAYEVDDAIRRRDWHALVDELGDLLFQVVFHARMAEENGLFDFDAVVAAICDKMERRHPHVFGTATVPDAAAQSHAWEEHKAKERSAETLAGVALGLPALKRAQKLQARVARVGFDWKHPDPALAKVHEELGELDAARGSGAGADKLEDELGDVLFAVVNLGRHLKIDAEAALARTNTKFISRFTYVEAALAAEGRGLAEASLDEMERHWQDAKRRERPA
ncbi:MAG: nucleoside triphosphate pyrophosphohydrolase [Alphaproteobacteria bacterium]